MATEQELFEQALNAHRRTAPTGQVQLSGAWLDLTDEQRQQLFEQTRRLRRMEALLDPAGRSTTVHAVLNRIRGTR